MGSERNFQHGRSDEGKPGNSDLTLSDARVVVREVSARARAAQVIADRWTQAEADEAAVAAGWAIVEPARNRALAEIAVRDTGLGNVADKIAKNRRKTMGLLREEELVRATLVAKVADHLSLDSSASLAELVAWRT